MRVEALRQRAQEFRGVGRLRRGPQLVVARLPPAIAQIVARAGAEDHRILRHHRHLRAHCGGIGFAQVDAVEQHAARGGIVEAFGELEQRRLARARGADHRHRFARADGERQVVDRRRIGARRIMEAHPLERERPRHRHGQGDRSGGSGDLGRLAQQFGNAARRARAAQQVAIDFGQRAERARDDAARHDEGEHAAARQAPGGDVGDALPHDQHDRPEDEADHDRGHHCAQRDAALRGGEGRVHRRAEARRLARFLTECLHDLHRAQRFGHQRADIGDPILRDARMRADAAAEDGDGQHDERNAKQQHAGKLGRKHEQIDHAADAGRGVAQRDRHGGADDRLDQRRVGRRRRRARPATTHGRSESPSPPRVPRRSSADSGKRHPPSPARLRRSRGRLPA
ncbi:hypothetical protein WR25_20171 [Diploscapter pachys]|uniref:Uncharacterized protein n=1 Tax=Diploscapter pachys TaxID=2018661 RepID=A0A2A2K803_9BILA|nr:hypothetical protein WR25_20171 [Diploscapter pachys]